jgi:hypothetical protein
LFGGSPAVATPGCRKEDSDAQDGNYARRRYGFYVRRGVDMAG